MTSLMRRFLRDESGSTAIEYGLIAALIAVAMAGAMTTLSGKLTAVFAKLASAAPVD
ncbi:MAG: Flp family type IVb pilin [Pseudomonadota bacterium]|uniref:Flp family type IVb pilin n=1 Tax=unclassified Phenylobacterium TaxID=2640670 RepID=UPI0009EC330A|nr:MULTISPECIES: Flp family type IVb pilin [unclassified Phenylobacterium]MBT9473289.1 Flp family type IVb pilin [Phenylobacterium sp.]